MRFTIRQEIHISEELLLCAIAEIILFNKILDLDNQYPKKLTKKNILAEIKDQLESYGYYGLDEEWRTHVGYAAYEEAKSHLEKFRHLIGS